MCWFAVNSVVMLILEGDKKLQNNIDQKCDLTNNVEYEEVFGQTAEETKLHGSEQRRVYCPDQYE